MSRYLCICFSLLVALTFVFSSVSVPQVGAQPEEAKPAEVEPKDAQPAEAQPDEPKDKATQKQQKKNKNPDVIYVPTPHEVVDKMLELAAVKNTDILYDLGCGDGRIVVTAAKKFGCKSFGFDVDPQRIKESNANVRKEKVGKLVKIRNQDIFTLDLSKADVVTLYLLPSLNVKLIPQLEHLKPGCRIVSHDFDMEGVEPDQVVELTTKDNVSHKVYLWTTPLKKTPREVTHAEEAEEAEEAKEETEAEIVPSF